MLCSCDLELSGFVSEDQEVIVYGLMCSISGFGVQVKSFEQIWAFVYKDNEKKVGFVSQFVCHVTK